MSSFIRNIVGPGFNYADNVPNPHQLEVSGSGGVESLWKDVGALAAYVDTITFGTKTISSPFDNATNQKPLGNKFFIKSGKCGKTSSDECKGVDRYIYINNIPSGKIPCLEQTGIKLPATNFRGLVPGMLENIMAINPIAIFNSLAGKGNISDKCSLRTEDVGSEGNYTKQSRCSPAGVPIQCLPAIFENFENKNENIEKSKKKYYLIILIFIIIFIIIYNK